MADILVATIIAYQQKHALEYVVLFSDDVETQAKAIDAGIEVASLPKDYLLGQATKVSSNTSKTAEKEQEPHVPTELRIDSNGLPVAFKHMIKQHKRHAAQKHKHDDDPVEVGIVIVADAQIFGRVA